MYIVDLLGAYTKGREYAIDRNWQDLKNYEAIEAARNNNDLGAMDILRQRMKLPGEISMYYDNVDNSIRNNRLGAFAQPGLEAMTQAKAANAVDMADVYAQLRQPYKSTMYDTALAGIGQQGAINDYTNGQVAFFNQVDANGNTIASNMGANAGYAANQQSLGNSILADNAVNASHQKVALSNQNYNNNYAQGQLLGLTTDNLIANQPLVQKNVQYQLEQLIPTMQKANQPAQERPPSVATIASYISLAQQGDIGAKYWLQHYGINTDGAVPQSNASPVLFHNMLPGAKTFQPLIPTPQQQVINNAQQTAKVTQEVAKQIPPQAVIQPIVGTYVGGGVLSNPVLGTYANPVTAKPVMNIHAGSW